MPSIKPLEAIVKELNKVNSASVASSELGMTPFIPDSANPSVGYASLSGVSGSMANAGSTRVRYHRLDLASLKLLWPTRIPIQRTPTLYEALLRISKVIGLTLTSKDVSDAPIAFNNGVASVTLVAKDTSQTVSGATPITLRLSDDISLPTQWVTSALSFDNPVASIPGLVPLLNSANNTSVEVQSVSWGDITSIDGEYNTQIVFSGKPAYGYVDNVTVMFNRAPLTTLFPFLYVFNQTAWTGTTRSFIQKFVPQMLTKILLTDIKDEPVSIGATAKDEVVVLTAANGTLNVGGKVNVNVYWSDPNQVTGVRSVLSNYAVDDNAQQAAVGQANLQYLVQISYPTSVRAVMASYAIDDNLQQAAVGQTNLQYLVQKFYPTNIRSVTAYYAVKDTL